MACGDDSGPVIDAAASDGAAVDAAPAADAGPDAGVPDAAPLNVDNCPDTYGPGSVASTFVIGGEGVGFDLDDDGAVDNALAAVAPLLNPRIADDLKNGKLILLSELRDLEDPTLATDDAALTVILYGGDDTDVPADPSDNFTGAEPFTYDTQWVGGPDCLPKAAQSASFVGGLLSASSDLLEFYLPDLGGFIQIAHARVEAMLVPDLAGARTPTGTPALVGGAVKQCALAKGDATLGASAQHALSLLGIQPDIDLDGDGKETVQHDSIGILGCTDGDGTTVVEGELCGCDPRMADGYSISFVLDLTGAAVVGPTAVP
jgi:hypothetical protein